MVRLTLNIYSVSYILQVKVSTSFAVEQSRQAPEQSTEEKERKTTNNERLAVDSKAK